MIEGMDDRHLIRLADNLIDAGQFGILLLFGPIVITILPLTLALPVMAAAGAFTVLSIVRRTNRHHDQHRAKSPPDPP